MCKCKAVYMCDGECALFKSLCVYGLQYFGLNVFECVVAVPAVCGHVRVNIYVLCVCVYKYVSSHLSAVDVLVFFLVLTHQQSH